MSNRESPVTWDLGQVDGDAPRTPRRTQIVRITPVGCWRFGADANKQIRLDVVETDGGHRRARLTTERTDGTTSTHLDLAYSMLDALAEALPRAKARLDELRAAEMQCAAPQRPQRPRKAARP